MSKDIKELEQYYVQIKGKNRHDVLNWAEKLRIFIKLIYVITVLG